MAMVVLNFKRRREGRGVAVPVTSCPLMTLVNET